MGGLSAHTRGAEVEGVKSRFWARVDIRGPESCWIWTGPVDPKGYGRHQFSRLSSRLAHRLAWQLANGDFPPLPVGQRAWVIMHKCDNPPCCNPAHLQLGTYADNSRDMSEKGRWNHDRALPFGEEHPNARLTEQQVIEIRRSTKSHVELAEHYGVARNTIAYVRQQGWAHLKVKAHKPENGKSRATRGANNPVAKLNDDIIRAIRASDAKPGALAKQYGIIPDYVTLIRKRKVWKHVD